MSMDEEIERVLAGDGSYDELTPQQQDVVRARWDERMAAIAGGLNLVPELEAAGRPWSELDENGKIVIHPGDPGE